MRVLALWILAFGIAVSPAIARAAGTGDDKDSTAAKKADTAKATTDSNAPAASSKADAPAKPATIEAAAGAKRRVEGTAPRNGSHATEPEGRKCPPGE